MQPELELLMRLQRREVEPLRQEPELSEAVKAAIRQVLEECDE
jgi:hypothetical protein